MTNPTNSPPPNSKAKAPATQFDDPAIAKRAEAQQARQPAQVTPEDKRRADAHPEEVPPPGDMGPSEGPGS